MNVQRVLQKARQLAKESGLTYQQIGELMGYPPESARQSVGQFLNGSNPSVAMLLRFAKAIGAKPRDLL
jgi:transcriptional regulator with XRE-family HTH domain